MVSSLLKSPLLTLFDYQYPDWSITVGYIIGFSSLMWIPIYMIYKMVWTPGSLKQVCEHTKYISDKCVHWVGNLIHMESFPQLTEARSVSETGEDLTRHSRRQPKHGHPPIERYCRWENKHPWVFYLWHYDCLQLTWLVFFFFWYLSS